jgi:hypothetical protein
MSSMRSTPNAPIVYRDADIAGTGDDGAQPEVFDRECRNYLEGPPSLLGDFTYANIGLATKDGLGKAMEVLEQGTDIGKLGRWFSYAWWLQDDTAAFVLSKEETPGNDTFSRLGIACRFMHPSEASKCSKYLKRLFSHHNAGMWFGEVVRRSHGRIAVKMANGAGLNFIVREVRKDGKGRAVDDGINYLTVSGFRVLTGRRVDAGSGFQITALEACGLIKGHVEIVEDGDLSDGVDGILIGPKKQVKALGNKFTIGFMQEIHGREEVYTDSARHVSAA